MRAFSVRWDPRLWLRDWLLKPDSDAQAGADVVAQGKPARILALARGAEGKPTVSLEVPPSAGARGCSDNPPASIECAALQRVRPDRRSK